MSKCLNYELSYFIKIVSLSLMYNSYNFSHVYRIEYNPSNYKNIRNTQYD